MQKKADAQKSWKGKVLRNAAACCHVTPGKIHAMNLGIVAD
jgi:hypothetical protein